MSTGSWVENGVMLYAGRHMHGATQFALFVFMLLAAGCRSDSRNTYPVSPSESAQVAVLDPGARLPERRAMVTEQLRSRGIADEKVLAVFEKVPRHFFIPPEQRPLAYSDQPVPIGYQQTISQPYIVALMTQMATLSRTDKVLEVGTGSGYQAAVLAELASQVFSIEIIPGLAQRAQSILTTMGYRNIVLRTGDGYAGWPEAAPFDAIILTAAPRAIPTPLLNQLAIGGTLVAPEGAENQMLVQVRRTQNGFEKSYVLGVRFVPMTGEALEGPKE